MVADGIALATRLLELDPLREVTTRQLIILLAQAGLRTAALARYETHRDLLRADLGLEPTADLARLYQDVRAGNIELVEPLKFTEINSGVGTPSPRFQSGELVVTLAEVQLAQQRLQGSFIGIIT